MATGNNISFSELLLAVLLADIQSTAQAKHRSVDEVLTDAV